MCYATGSVPCCDACDDAGRCLLSEDEEKCDEKVPCHACVNAVWVCALCGRDTTTGVNHELRRRTRSKNIKKKKESIPSGQDDRGWSDGIHRLHLLDVGLQ